MKGVIKKTAKDIDKLLKRIKDETGLTQEKIADKIGYSRPYLSQAKKTDSEKLYIALSTTFFPKEINVRNLTNLSNGEKVGDEKKLSLERSIENLTENELRTTALLERMMTLLEQQYGADERFSPPGTKGTKTLSDQLNKKTGG